MHVRQHIENFVLTRISTGRGGEWMFEGNVLSRGGPMFYRREMFVDPRDGLLKDMSVLDKLLAKGSKGGAR